MISGVELLKSATKYGKNVKAIVVTGSVNAITTGADVTSRIFTSEEWLPVSPIIMTCSHSWPYEFNTSWL
jgi:hypothetical protein